MRVPEGCSTFLKNVELQPESCWHSQSNILMFVSYLAEPHNQSNVRGKGEERSSSNMLEVRASGGGQYSLEEILS